MVTSPPDMRLSFLLVCAVVVLVSHGYAEPERPGRAMTGKAYLFQSASPAEGKKLTDDYLASGWDAGKLQELTASPMTLFSSRMLLPLCHQSVVAMSFNLPAARTKGVLTTYEGRVVAPESGWFRFVGMGDDRLVVRFGGKVVLDASSVQNAAPSDTPPPSRSRKKGGKNKASQGPLKIEVPGADTWNRDLKGLTAGSSFRVEKGKKYAISLLYCNYGGNAGFALLVQRLKKKDSARSLTRKLGMDEELDLFITTPEIPTRAEYETFLGKYCVGTQMEWLSFNQDSLVWAGTQDAADAVLNGAFESAAPGSAESAGEEETEEASENESRKKRKKSSKSRRRASLF